MVFRGYLLKTCGKQAGTKWRYPVFLARGFRKSVLRRYPQDFHSPSPCNVLHVRLFFSFCSCFHPYRACQRDQPVESFPQGTSHPTFYAQRESSRRDTAGTAPASCPSPAVHHPLEAAQCGPPCATALPRSARRLAARAGSCARAAPMSRRSLARWSRAGCPAGAAGRAWRREAQGTRRSERGSTGCTSEAGRWAWWYFTPPSSRRGSCGGSVRSTWNAWHRAVAGLPKTMAKLSLSDGPVRIGKLS